MSFTCWYEGVNRSICPQCPALHLRVGQDQGENMGRLARPSFGNRQRGEVLLRVVLPAEVSCKRAACLARAVWEVGILKRAELLWELT